MKIFSYRVAPIQINYLGYPGTSGSNQIDYIIGDKVVIPNNYRKYYSEKVLHMPHCFMPFDNKTRISKKNFIKNDFDLPEDAFILAAFHKNEKITEKEINSWSKILTNLPSSIIWIQDMKDEVKYNFLKAFNQKGITSEKIHFCKKVKSREEHLARHSCADIFIDTFNYNAHSTAIDALWSELPVVTLMGRGFSGRVAASILTTLGLKDLIANSIEEYEEIIINLGKNAEKLELIKRKIKSEKINNVLFNSVQYTKDLEKLYLELIDKETQKI